MENYPPEFDGPEYCLVCNKHVASRESECECPECPECSEVGDPECYANGHMEKGNRAFNIADLAAHVSASRDNASAIAKRLFKDTQCGISFHAEPESVSVAGYAEGSDAECEPIVLEFPIDLDAFDAAVTRADAEGCAMWHEWNDHEGEVA